MKGRRVYADANGWFSDKLEPGDYVKIDPKNNADGTPLPADWAWRTHYPYWIGCAPNGHACALGAHKVEEHEDGTITVSPSILISRGGPKSAGNKPYEELFHGFLERGVWRTA